MIFEKENEVFIIQWPPWIDIQQILEHYHFRQRLKSAAAENCWQFVIQAVYVLVKIKLLTFKCRQDGGWDINDEEMKGKGPEGQGSMKEIIATNADLWL